MPIAKLDANFKNLLGSISEAVLANAAAVTDTAKRAWMRPPTGEWTGDPMDIEGLNKAFDRTEANTLYDKALHAPKAQGKLGDCAATKLQVDYVAVAERAYRTRHASRIRCMVHAAGRLRGHGDPAKGLYTDSVIPYIQDIIKGTSDPTVSAATTGQSPPVS